MSTFTFTCTFIFITPSIVYLQKLATCFAEGPVEGEAEAEAVDAEERTVQGVVVAEAEAEAVAEEAEANNNHPKSRLYAPAVCYQNISKLHAFRCIKI